MRENMPLLLARHWYQLGKFCLKVRDYRPRRVTPWRIIKWLSQYPSRHREDIISLLLRVRYVSLKETRETILRLHTSLMNELDDLAVPRRSTLYVTFSDTASSSHDMLSLLRNDAVLERTGIHIVDARDVNGFRDIISRIEEGVIIYIDDFVGSARQFTAERQFIMSHVPEVGVVGKFAEYLLCLCVCEEGASAVSDEGVEIRCGIRHTTSERPLHSACSDIANAKKESLLRECGSISSSRHFLGVEDMATMVVIYRNAPTNMSLLFRGDIRQKPLMGIFPRTTDLPVT